MGADAEADGPLGAGDLLVFSATEPGVRALWGSPRFGLALQRLYQATVAAGEHGTLQDLKADGDLMVIAAQTDKPLRETLAIAGGTCFVTGAGPQSLADAEHVGLWQEASSRTPQPRNTWLALSILDEVILSATLGLLPIELAAVTGALLMVLTGVLTPASAARGLDWNVLFILAGSVGLGNVVVSSGLATLIADTIAAVAADNVLIVVVTFAITTALMTNIVTNAATASISTPVALAVTADLVINPVITLALIGTCISFTFINPFSHQSNLMVMEPRGYSRATFARFGLPLYVAGIFTACVVGYLLLR